MAKTWNRTCPECKKDFISNHPSRVVCYNDKCRIQRRNRQSRENNWKYKSESYQRVEKPIQKIRPYTDDSPVIIVSDLMRGRSVKEIADLLNRDPDDLKAYIKKIEQDGTYAKAKRIIKRHAKFNPYANY